MRLRRLFWIILCVAALAVVPVLAEVSIQLDVHEQHGSSVTLPQVSGMENTFVQDIINQAIQQQGGYQLLLANLDAATPDGGGAVQAEAETEILTGRDGQDVLTVRIEASGRIGPGRPSHRVTALMFSMTTGERITAEDIFLDVAQAEEQMGQLIEEHVDADFTGYLDPGAYLPLPMDNLLMDQTGISLFYDAQQNSLLSGRCASVRFHYDEVQPLLNLSEGSLLWNLRLDEKLMPSATTAAAIRADAARGYLPGILLRLGDNAQEALQRFPKAADSMSFPGGLRYQLEDDRFRGTSVIVDGGAVSGLISKRMNLHGLVVGKATREDVEGVLGQSAAALEMDETTAERYALPAGTVNDYLYDSFRLRLLFDDQQVLRAVWLAPSGV